MHHQPEATSLPIGQDFCEQFHAISTLRSSFPDEINIFIKEHPYTYKQPIDPRFRPPKYYEMIKISQKEAFLKVLKKNNTPLKLAISKDFKKIIEILAKYQSYEDYQDYEDDKNK